MTNVEIYDSSNSELSSDEYSNDEDDDALMDVAVSKQADPKSDPKSTETSPTKADSATTTPGELSNDLDAIAGGSSKPPDSREVTQRQIKQMQRNNQANLYFKRRSIRWLQRLSKKIDYLGELKVMLPAREAQAKRMAERLAKKQALRLQEMAKRNERTPSRSRTQSSGSSGASESEVVCLDDTENEDSPEKLTESVARHFEKSVPDVVVKKPNTPLNLKLETEAAETSDEVNILDEFLTMKPAVKPVAEPVVGRTVVINVIRKQQQASQPELPVQHIVEPAANLQKPVEDISNKRRRSNSPPAAAQSPSDKRTKVSDTDSFDDDIFELLPPQPAPVKQPTQTRPTHPPVPTTFTWCTPALKLGSPYTLTPSGGMDLFAQKKAQSQQQQQSAISYSLETPTPPVEPMEFNYPTAKTLPQRESIKTAQAASIQPVGVQQHASLTAAAPHPAVQQQQMSQLQQPQQKQQQHYQQSQPSVNWQMPKPRKVMGQTPIGAVPAGAVPAGAAPTAAAPTAAAPTATAPTTAAPTTAAPTAAAAPTTHNRSNPTDLNNSNSNGNFYQSIRETYPEFDELLTERLNTITPELSAMRQEAQRNSADIETLKNLLTQKEDEWNRLEHLMCVKTELLARIERKKRIFIMKEVLQLILSRNCSDTEIYELDTLLYKESNNATKPSRFSPTTMERLIESVANDPNDIPTLKGFLGVREKYSASAETPIPPPPPPQLQSYYGSQINRHNSVPAMRPPASATRPPVPPAAVGRSASYSRHNDSEWDHHHAEREIESLPPSRSKVPPPLSRSQQPINKYKDLFPSAPDLSFLSSAYPGRLDTQPGHFLDWVNPLHNSSPLVASKSPINPRNDTQPQFNDQHSIYFPEARHVSRSNNNNTNKSTRLLNGTLERNPECRHCGRPNAEFGCPNCTTMRYCSRECQTLSWADGHWKTCG